MSNINGENQTVHDNGSDHGSKNSVESSDTIINGSDKVEQILTAVNGIQTRLTNLESGQSKMNTELTSVKGSVEAFSNQLGGFSDKIEGQDSKIAGQDSKIEGQDAKIEGQSKSNQATHQIVVAQDAKIESSRITTQHKVVAVIVAIILFLIATRDFFPDPVKIFFGFGTTTAKENFILVAGYTVHQLKSISMAPTSQLHQEAMASLGTFTD